VQATAVTQQATASELARDLFTLLGYLLKGSSHDVFSAIGELDLSLTQIKLLHVLDGEAGVSLKHVGTCVGLSLPAASRAIEGLHQRGLVQRHEDEHDRRIKRVEVTPAGREVVERLNQARLSYLEQFAQTLSETERKRLHSALGPVLSRAPIAPAAPGEERR